MLFNFLQKKSGLNRIFKCILIFQCVPCQNGVYKNQLRTASGKNGTTKIVISKQASQINQGSQLISPPIAGGSFFNSR